MKLERLLLPAALLCAAAPLATAQSTFEALGLTNLIPTDLTPDGQTIVGTSLFGSGVWMFDDANGYVDLMGNGGNPAGSGTPGGGSGGAIYNDGNTMTLSLCGSRIEYNEVNAHGRAIFFVTNDHSGNIRIDRCVITNNIGGSWYPTHPQISNHSDTPIEVIDSVIE